jgi:hypothetical protein
LVVTPSGSVIVTFARTCPSTSTSRAGTCDVAKRGGERVILGQRQDRDRLDAGSRTDPGDVDPLAPGILARRGS